MQDINNGTRPDLMYEHMDATEMTYPDEKFSVVLDKGTLDALMPDSKEATVSTVDKYFKVHIITNYYTNKCLIQFILHKYKYNLYKIP